MIALGTEAPAFELPDASAGLVRLADFDAAPALVVVFMCNHCPYVQRVAPAIIARTYYDPDDDGFAATPSAMERHLHTMLDGLVKVAIEQGSPALADCGQHPASQMFRRAAPQFVSTPRHKWI